MTRDKVLEFFVYQIKKYSPSVPVVIAKQDYANSASTCIIIDLMAERCIGDQELWNADNEAISIVGLRQATLNVQAYGRGSVELLGGLWGYFEHPLVVDEFQSANVAVNVAGDVQDLTNLLDNHKYIERASIDFTISYDREFTLNELFFNKVISTIAVADMTGTIEVAKGENDG